MTELKKSTLTHGDMKKLLDVYDALEDLDSALETIIGYKIGIGSEAGLMRVFGYVADIICQSSPIFSTGDEERDWFYDLLDNRSVDNDIKASIFLNEMDKAQVLKDAK